jgi:hypothetical protein
VGTRGVTVSHGVAWRYAIVTDEQAAAGIVGQAPGVIESAERIDRTIITGVIEFA